MLPLRVCLQAWAVMSCLECPLLQYYIFSGLLLLVSLRLSTYNWMLEALTILILACLFGSWVGPTLLSVGIPLCSYLLVKAGWFSYQYHGKSEFSQLQLLFPELSDFLADINLDINQLFDEVPRMIREHPYKEASVSLTVDPDDEDFCEDLNPLKQDYCEQWLAAPLFWVLQSSMSFNIGLRLVYLAGASFCALILPTGSYLSTLLVAIIVSKEMLDLRELTRLMYHHFKLPYIFFDGQAFLTKFLATANWPMVFYISLVHLCAGLSLYRIYSTPSDILFSTWCVFTCFFYLSGFGITAGAHRLWAHRSYKATLPFRMFLMIGNSVANQGTIYHWARDHRVHHLYSDSEGDPHDSFRGFFYAHVGWLLVDKHTGVADRGKSLDVSDLEADVAVRIQRYLDPWWNMSWCFGAPTLLAYLMGQSLGLSFLICGMLRYCLVLHVTWCVNSVVHTFGERPYNRACIPTENRFVALVAGGEGWHSYHHMYPQDYACAELGAWSQCNITKVLIDTMAFFGLAYNLKRSTKAWNLRLKHRLEDVEEKTGKPHTLKLWESGPPMFKVRQIEFVPLEESTQDSES